MNGSHSGLQPVDWMLIAAYVASTIALGVYFGRKQRCPAEYFVGSGNMNPFLVGVSLFATLLSTISYLSMPGEAAGRGPVFLVSLAAFPPRLPGRGLWAPARLHATPRHECL